MTKNRLKLDFSLETARERTQFINSYIVQFEDEKGVSSLTSNELETISNYILWGKDELGKPIGAETQLETKWTKTNENESLDALMESQTFSDLHIYGLNEAISFKKPRVVFSRQEVRRVAPAHIVEVFEELWKKIDQIDLEINFYELKTGKRINPPREKLLNRFTQDEQDKLREKAKKLTQWQYLKLRHELIELRREQFSLKDSFTSTINPIATIPTPKTKQSIVFDCDVEVFPLGVKEGELGLIIFEKEVDPARFDEQQLRKISDFIQLKTQKEKLQRKSFDFRKIEPIYQLYLNKEELENQIKEEKDSHIIETNLEALLETLKFYEEIADLNESQREILELKVKHVKNQDIASYINQKYGKSYTANYISTIFRQKIIVKINEAASLHEETVKNWFFPENFKRCSCCGRLLLLDERNWVKKSRSKDGFQNKCKRCEREARRMKKEK